MCLWVMYPTCICPVLVQMLELTAISRSTYGTSFAWQTSNSNCSSIKLSIHWIVIIKIDMQWWLIIPNESCFIHCTPCTARATILIQKPSVRVTGSQWGRQMVASLRNAWASIYRRRIGLTKCVVVFARGLQLVDSSAHEIGVLAERTELQKVNTIRIDGTARMTQGTLNMPDV